MLMKTSLAGRGRESNLNLAVSHMLKHYLGADDARLVDMMYGFARAWRSKLRVLYPGAIYHGMSRGDRREAMFEEESG